MNSYFRSLPFIVAGMSYVACKFHPSSHDLWIQKEDAPLDSDSPEEVDLPSDFQWQAQDAVIPLDPDARNHTQCRCPLCSGMIRDNSAGNIPGAVKCLTCEWEATCIQTHGELAGGTGPSIAVFQLS